MSVFFLLLRYALCSLRYALKPGTPLALSQIISMDRQEQPLDIQQVSLKLKIPKPTLRFWEREFEGILVPLRTKGGQRRYTLEHISIIKEIKNLRSKGKSLAEIKRKLSNSRKVQGDNSDSNRIDFLANRVADIVKAEVYGFFEREYK